MRLVPQQRISLLPLLSTIAQVCQSPAETLLARQQARASEPAYRALHAHLLASVPNGFILESFANPDRDPFWFEIYDRKPRIEKSILYLDDTPGLGVEFNQKALARYGTKII